MILDLLVGNFWLSASLWMVLMILDNLQSMTAVRLYREGARRHQVLQDGSELNPLFQDDVAHRRLFSPRFMVVLSGGYLVAWLVWSLTRAVEGSGVLYEFLLGILLLVHGPIQVRHARTLLLFHYLCRSHGVRGRIFFDSWLTLRLAALDHAACAVLYLMVLSLTGRPFFAGGGAGCAAMAFSHWRPAPPEPPSDETDG